MEPVMARKMWRSLEPVHGMIYFVPEAAEEYAAIGITGRTGYFASRSAPMGAVPAEVVIATFFNFHPGLVRHAMAPAWSTTTPSVLVDARFRAADRALRRLLTDELVAAPEVAEAARLAREAAEGCTPDGRPLSAGHASLPWPDEPHLVLWHAISVLREFRGDGHVAALVTHQIGPLAALLLHAGSGEVAPAVLRATRSWSDEEWEAEADRLRAAGWLDESGELTEAGARERQEVEDHTDAMALAPWARLGADGCDRLREIGRGLSKAIVAAGALSTPPSGEQPG